MATKQQASRLVKTSKKEAKTRYALTGAKMRQRARSSIKGHTTIDSKNRITISKIVLDKIREITRTEDISSFNFSLTENGDLVLKAMSTIPSREMWLFKNKKALESILIGIKDAKEGRIAEFDPDGEEA